MNQGRAFVDGLAGMPSVAKWAMVAAGIGLLAVGGFALAKTLSLVISGERTTGTIVGLEPVHDPRSQSRTWARIVEYKHPRSGVTRMTERVSRTTAGEGNEVPVLYDPENPGRALVGSSVNLWVAPLAQLLFGVLCAGVGWMALARK